MSYYETDFNLCRTCYIKIKKPPKKLVKKIILTTYEGQCENCGKYGRLVDLIWDEDDKEYE